jgi:hypothetical protein
MRCSIALLSICAVLAAAAPARAQSSLLPSRPLDLSPPPDRLTTAQAKQMDEWLRAMAKWQKTDRRWHNEPAHDPFGRILKRATQPEPPGWLDARCQGLAAEPEGVAGAAGQLAAACRLLAQLNEDPAADAIRAATAAQRSNEEASVKDSFLTRVHLDGLWTTTSTDVRLYGLVGSHISLVDIGRVQFFGPPGVLVLSVPGPRGREIRAGYDWGMSVRLRDIRLFSPAKNMTLFLTLSKVWLTGATFDRLAPGGFDIAGFSLAPRKPRR